MGAWGSGAFDNDSALDFVQRLARVDPADRADVILSTLRKAGGRPLDVDDASAVVAAAQLVAFVHREADFASLDQRLADLSAATVGSTDVAHLTGDVAKLRSAATLTLAVEALDRVLSTSELRRLWPVFQGVDELADSCAPIRAALLRPPLPRSSVVRVASPREPSHPPGTIFRIDFDEDWHTYGRTLEVPIFFEVYDRRTQEPLDDLAAIAAAPVLFAIAGRTTHWPAVGPLAPEVTPLHPVPDRFVQQAPFYDKPIIVSNRGSELRRLVTPPECIGLERAVSWTKDQVAERIRDHYTGRANREVERRTVQLGPPWSAIVEP